MGSERLREILRIQNLQNGIKLAEKEISKAMWVFNSGEALSKEQQDKLENDLGEIRSFLLGLSQQ